MPSSPPSLKLRELDQQAPVVEYLIGVPPSWTGPDLGGSSETEGTYPPSPSISVLEEEKLGSLTPDPLMQDIDFEIQRLHTSEEARPKISNGLNNLLYPHIPAGSYRCPLVTAPLGPSYHVTHPIDVAKMHFRSARHYRNRFHRLKHQSRAEYATNALAMDEKWRNDFRAGKVGAKKMLRKRVARFLGKDPKKVTELEMLHGQERQVEAQLRELDGVLVEVRKRRARWEKEREMWRDGLDREERGIFLRWMGL